MKTRRFYFWLPAYFVPVVVVALFHPGVFSPRVHWSESVGWAASYPLVLFAAPYWITRWAAKDLHPAWPAAIALLTSLALIGVNSLRW